MQLREVHSCSTGQEILRVGGIQRSITVLTRIHHLLRPVHILIKIKIRFNNILSSTARSVSRVSSLQMFQIKCYVHCIFGSWLFRVQKWLFKGHLVKSVECDSSCSVIFFIHLIFPHWNPNIFHSTSSSNAINVVFSVCEPTFHTNKKKRNCVRSKVRFDA